MTLKEELLKLNFVVDNEYLDKYVELVETNRNTKREKFKTQKHHIIPKCISKIIQYQDENSKHNIVNLTHENHLYAHWLLYKIASTENYKYRLGNAIIEMADKKGNRHFETLSEKKIKEIAMDYDEIVTFVNLELSKRMKNRVVSEESKKKMSDYWLNYHKNGGISHHKNKKHSQESKNKISIGNRGKKRTKECRERMSKRMLGKVSNNKGKKLHYSDEALLRIKSRQLKWFNNGEVEIRISKEDVLNKGVPENFIPGRLNGYQNNKESLERRNEKMRQKMWMNNGKISKMIDKDKIHLYKNDGWIFGRLPFKDINNK